MSDRRSRFGLSKAVEDKVKLANLQANIVSTLQGGCFVGALAAAWFADRLGRRLSLIITAVIVMIGVIMQFNSWGKLPVLYVGRYGARSAYISSYSLRLDSWQVLVSAQHPCLLRFISLRTCLVPFVVFSLDSINSSSCSEVCLRSGSITEPTCTSLATAPGLFLWLFKASRRCSCSSV